MYCIFKKTNEEFAESTEWETILADANYYWLDWSGNPLICDCAMEPFLTWVYNGLRLELYRALSGYHDIVCHELVSTDSGAHKKYKRKLADQSLAKQLQNTCQSIQVTSEETPAFRSELTTPPSSLLPESNTTSDVGNILLTASQKLTTFEQSFARLLQNISAEAGSIFNTTTTMPKIESFSVASICNSTNCISQSKSAMQRDSKNTDERSSSWPPWLIGIFVGIDLALLLALLMKIYMCHKNHKRVSPHLAPQSIND